MQPCVLLFYTSFQRMLNKMATHMTESIVILVQLITLRVAL